MIYKSEDSTGEPRLAPVSPPRSSLLPFIIVEEDEFLINEDKDAELALAEARVTLVREEAEAKAQA